MRNRKSEIGFSLVEMMVVVVIVGLMTSVVVLTLPTSDSGLEQRAARTEEALTALSRRSVMTGQILGVRFSAEGFETVRLSSDGWVVENAILKPEVQSWPSARLLELAVDNVDIDFSELETNPHIWFLPTGEYPSFNLMLSAGTEKASITAPASGLIEALYNG